MKFKVAEKGSCCDMAIVFTDEHELRCMKCKDHLGYLPKESISFLEAMLKQISEIRGDVHVIRKGITRNSSARGR